MSRPSLKISSALADNFLPRYEWWARWTSLATGSTQFCHTSILSSIQLCVGCMKQFVRIVLLSRHSRPLTRSRWRAVQLCSIEWRQNMQTDKTLLHRGLPWWLLDGSVWVARYTSAVFDFVSGTFLEMWWWFVDAYLHTKWRNGVLVSESPLLTLHTSPCGSITKLVVLELSSA
jgi:hypothetical protein